MEDIARSEERRVGKEIIEFWWDALNKYKISPKAMTSYGRDESNAVFVAGDAAFTLVDSTHFGRFNDPKKSKIAGKVGLARWPLGPRRNTAIAWNDIWGWAIPKGAQEEVEDHEQNDREEGFHGQRLGDELLQHLDEIVQGSSWAPAD